MKNTQTDNAEAVRSSALGRWWIAILALIVLAVYWKASVTITVNSERTHKDSEAWLWRFDAKAP